MDKQPFAGQQSNGGEEAIIGTGFQLHIIHCLQFYVHRLLKYTVIGLLELVLSL